VIPIHDEPRILSQTQRRRRYPDHQQHARYNNLQPSHGAEKYSLDCLISSQMFLAPITAKLLLVELTVLHLTTTWERLFQMIRETRKAKKNPIAYTAAEK
jgi:hypothetical protein